MSVDAVVLTAIDMLVSDVVVIEAELVVEAAMDTSTLTAGDIDTEETVDTASDTEWVGGADDPKYASRASTPPVPIFERPVLFG